MQQERLRKLDGIATQPMTKANAQQTIQTQIAAATLATLPAELVAAVQRCEKAYCAGRYYVTVPRGFLR